MSTSIDPRAIFREMKARDPEQILIFYSPWTNLYGCFDTDAMDVVNHFDCGLDTQMMMYRDGTQVTFAARDLEPLLTRIVEAGRRAAVLEPVKSAGGESVERIVIEGQS